MRWWIPFFVGAVAAFAGWIIGRRPRGLSEAVKTEFAALEAAKSARENQIKFGTSEAKNRVEFEHAAAIMSLDEKQKLKADELRDDPSALARFLVRVGSRSSKP